MFYIFFMGCDTGFDQIKKVIYDIMLGKEGYNPRVVEDGEKIFDILCKYFALRVKIDYIGTRFRCEDYRLNLNCQLWFDAYRTDENWMKEMLSFVGTLMKIFDGECAFESNADSPPIMYRRDNKVIVDGSRFKGTEKFPFHFLGVEYTEGSTMDLIQNNADE